MQQICDVVQTCSHLQWAFWFEIFFKKFSYLPKKDKICWRKFPFSCVKFYVKKSEVCVHIELSTVFKSLLPAPSCFLHLGFTQDPLKSLECFPDPHLNWIRLQLCKSVWPLLASLWMSDAPKFFISITAMGGMLNFSIFCSWKFGYNVW